MVKQSPKFKSRLINPACVVAEPLWHDVQLPPSPGDPVLAEGEPPLLAPAEELNSINTIELIATKAIAEITLILFFMIEIILALENKYNKIYFNLKMIQ